MNGEIHLSAFADSLLRDTGAATSAVDDPASNAGLILGSHATSVVYSLLSREDRREHGVFFSGPIWAKTLAEHVDVSRWNRFVDPSAGTGDLLLEVCRSFPVADSIDQTLKLWSDRLFAVDLRVSFLRIAWTRLVKLAALRHDQILSPPQVDLLLQLPATFVAGDMLVQEFELNAGDCVIMNPPYQRVLAGSDSFVGQGLRSAAALHVERILKKAPAGVGIVALVPEVLRTGTSYKRFRKELHERIDVVRFDSLGGFGQSANVDVVVVAGVTKSQSLVKTKLTKEIKKSSSATQEKYVTQSVGHKFKVRVGPVVPHRTSEKGEWRGYLTAKNSLVWGTVSQPVEQANFDARLEKGPLVVIRRTSSPSDKQRARATLITSREEFLIENHLIVCKPLTGGVRACRELIGVLKDERTDSWLNENLRCRHLTVGAIATMPWWKSEK